MNVSGLSDFNGDGKISLMDYIIQETGITDINSDGKIDVVDIAMGLLIGGNDLDIEFDPESEVSQQSTTDSIDEAFSKFDKNDDGYMGKRFFLDNETKSEFSNTEKNILNGLYTSRSRDNSYNDSDEDNATRYKLNAKGKILAGEDGKISAEELRSLDTNGDGEISEDEINSIQRTNREYEYNSHYSNNPYYSKNPYQQYSQGLYEPIADNEWDNSYVQEEDSSEISNEDVVYEETAVTETAEMNEETSKDDEKKVYITKRLEDGTFFKYDSSTDPGKIEYGDDGQITLTGWKNATIRGTTGNDNYKIVDSENVRVDGMDGDDTIKVVDSENMKVDGSRGNDNIMLENVNNSFVFSDKVENPDDPSLSGLDQDSVSINGGLNNEHKVRYTYKDVDGEIVQTTGESTPEERSKLRQWAAQTEKSAYERRHGIGSYQTDRLSGKFYENTGQTKESYELKYGVYDPLPNF